MKGALITTEMSTPLVQLLDAHPPRRLEDPEQREYYRNAADWCCRTGAARKPEPERRPVTPRQQQVYDAIVNEGLPMETVAGKLGISYYTARELFRKAKAKIEGTTK
jgi:DNA-binding NarL/FixJ family response regulator